MNEGDYSQRKKRWRPLRHSHSDLSQDSGMRATGDSEPSSVPLSRTGRSNEIIGRLWDKVTKDLPSRGARQYSNSSPTSSSTHSPIFSRPRQHTPPATEGQTTNSGAAKVEPDPEEEIANVQSGLDAVDWVSSIRAPLKEFNSSANTIIDVPPYAKVALSIFTCASKMILDQADWDIAISNLLAKVSDIYCFMTKDDALARIPSMQTLYGKIARQMLECADFIVHYSEVKSVYRDPIIRRALACVVRDDDELRHTRDITKQWEKFVLAPVDAALKAVNAPVLIVIDSLDESGDARSREHILRVLAGKPDTFSLPANIRVVVTSRPLEDIHRSLCDAPHVCHTSLDDILPASTERDIQLYVATKLERLRDIFHDTHFQTLARKSDGLFEWARLACEYIKDTNKAGVEPMDRFDDVTAGFKTGTRLLDDMYVQILAEIMPQDKKAIARVSSVMGQILASFEPLSMASLTAMRLQFPGEARDYKIEWVIKPLGLLFTGTTDSHSPIRPRHPSFYEFLTDKLRSGKFFVDVSLVKMDVAFASIRVMKAELHFNICSLESSYLPNSAVPNLEERVKKSISAELSYSSRFWGTHVRATFFDSSLAEEIMSFFDGECLLFWLEALALMKDLSGSMGTLSSVADWLTVRVLDLINRTNEFL
ncbi:hypothetical protein AZE42_12246 [Rhizopogon vesiculosus]|uniref:Nephrocystin 3-like N-terminal domain-containing protein n=1 Tax=Rhizopogon vesiculosus TaxID=180088 RepID=A0A1J8Q777_9AGAM|nr:hypothetical protein AZE42_12246 [Rhizopogon vesiculosus]